ncbi:MAG: C69 family dipeptidase [Candidatus Thorarchaeota archaeon]|nr:C69 family dipeptidase [Candidatus Thorarchaeota archaeon]
MPEASADSVMLFGKNSDRPPNEAQVVEYVPSKIHNDKRVKCTHMSIPQVEETLAMYISRPSWMWGAEMGANEKGVVIGNEAVFSKQEVPETGLLGMDLLRLGLERGETADQALSIMVDLLEKHGQGGICARNQALTYHNSYIIADSKEAWVLETSGRQWVAQKVEGVRAISNGYTITNQWDRASEDLIEHAIKMGWYDGENQFSFAAAYGNEAMRYIARCDDRLSKSTTFLKNNFGKMDFVTLTNLLRNHPDDWKPWNQPKAAICQHAGHQNSYVTAASQISELGDDVLHWFTGSSNPCTSVYWPFTFNSPSVYNGFDNASEKYSRESYWWIREKQNRALSKRFDRAMREFKSIVAKHQDIIYRLASRKTGQQAVEREIKKHTKHLQEIIDRTNPEEDLPAEFVEYWKEKNAEADMDSE